MIDPLPSSPRVATPRWRLRSLACGFALSAAVVAGAVHLDAQTIAHHNSNAPVNFSADRMELQDKQKRVVLTGNVDITQEDCGSRPRAPRWPIPMRRPSRCSASMRRAAWW
jgi:lipopolysaccharide export system protein LptA